MNRILGFSQYCRLVLESEGPTSKDESHYPKNSPQEIQDLKSAWEKYKKMGREEKKKFKEEVNSIVGENLEKAKKYYVNYFSLPEVKEKIKILSPGISEKKLEEKFTGLMNFIKKVKVKSFLNKNIFTKEKGSWGYVIPLDPSTINLNIFNFWVREESRRVYETILHEMAHSIDFYFSKEKIPTKTVKKMFSDKTYLESSQEQYARLQSFRKDLSLPSIVKKEGEIADKIIELFNNKKIKIKENPVLLESTPVKSEDGKSLIFPLKRKANTSPQDEVAKMRMASVFQNVLEFDPSLSEDFNYFIANFSRISDDQMSLVLDLEPIVQYHNQVAKQGSDGEKIA